MKKICFLALSAAMLTACAAKKTATLNVAGEWKICQIQDMAMAATVDIPLPTISFDEAGYHLYCGCNYVNGLYKIEDDKVNFTAGASTKMMCPDVMELEDAIVGLLQGTYTITAEEDALVIANEAGATVLRLMK